jgi:hypothetical protein
MVSSVLIIFLKIVIWKMVIFCQFQGTVFPPISPTSEFKKKKKTER